MPEIKYDIMIIGGGPAGLTAGLYASRGGMKTLLIEKMGCGGQAAIADWIENYPGFSEGVNGFELTAKMEEQAKKYGLNIQVSEVKTVKQAQSGGFEASTPENTFSADALVLSTGASFEKLGVPGENEFLGKGVSYCATCDGPFFKNKNLVVVGGGNSAVQEAVYLTHFAQSVTVIHRRNRLRAVDVLQKRAECNPKVKIMLNSTVESIEGGNTVESVIIKNVETKNTSRLNTDGVFIFVGQSPNSGFAKGFIKMDDKGYILTDDNMAASVPGVFACGDVRRKGLRQVITAAGDGAAAAYSAQEYVENLRGTNYSCTPYVKKG